MEQETIYQSGGNAAIALQNSYVGAIFPQSLSGCELAGIEGIDGAIQQVKSRINHLAGAHSKHSALTEGLKTTLQLAAIIFLLSVMALIPHSISAESVEAVNKGLAVTPFLCFTIIVYLKGPMKRHSAKCKNVKAELEVCRTTKDLTPYLFLSSVNGVYLIQDTLSGKLDVGSAYGDQGIYGRWSTYAGNDHGGNLKLQNLNPSNFVFSILEIVQATTTAEGVIECENRWKEKLGIRQFGLNKN